MKQAVMKKWVKALRSGKYKQTRGKLHNTRGGGYCCLGVLCEISPETWDRNGGIPPLSVRKWSGLHTRNGEYLKKDGSDGSLSRLNDTNKWNFKKIANFIETNWRKL